MSLNIKIDKTKIKNKFYTTLYFKNTHQILKKHNPNVISTMQFVCFNDKEYMLCGIEEIKEVLKAYLTPKQLKTIEFYSRNDGDIIKKNEPVLLLKGHYHLFCELENIIDSILARRSSVATNCYYFLKYLKPEQLIYMSDRSDDYLLHPYDGYSAYVAGVRNFSNDSHIEFINDEDVKVYGSMPHALIHQFHGDINKVLDAYLKEFADVSLLVDFNNDIISTLKSVDQKYYHFIKSIRLDTSKNKVDKSLINLKINKKKLVNVNPYLVKKVRHWLDTNGLSHVKIVATSENSLEKIKEFKAKKVAVDYYGIGSNLTKLSLHFTADLVQYNNQNFAKNGRKLLDTSKLIKFNW